MKVSATSALKINLSLLFLIFFCSNFTWNEVVLFCQGGKKTCLRDNRNHPSTSAWDVRTAGKFIKSCDLPYDSISSLPPLKEKGPNFVLLIFISSSWNPLSFSFEILSSTQLLFQQKADARIILRGAQFIVSQVVCVPCLEERSGQPQLIGNLLSRLGPLL